MSEFMDKHPGLFLAFIVYLVGAFILYVITTFLMFWRFISRNSIPNQNLRLFGSEFNWANGIQEGCEAGVKPLGEELGIFAGAAFLLVFNALLMNWIGVLLLLLIIPAVLKGIFDWLLAPARIREIRWRLRNVAFVRAEDMLAITAEYQMLSPQVAAQRREEIRVHVENIASNYAMSVWPSEPVKSEKYMDLARKLSKERFDSEIIHPSFWHLPLNETAALCAVERL